MRHTPVQTGSTATALPVPDADAQAHSLRLIDHIKAEIDACGGSIGFARYMELVLYAPGLGYYSAGSRKFGPEGDFVTAPELSPLFSQALARQLAEILSQPRLDEVLEIGAGSGVMAADILAALAEQDRLPVRYRILERSAELRARQQQTLGDRVPQLLDRVQWLDALPDADVSGVVVANELLDALPVHRIQQTAEGYRECHVAWQDGRFVWRLVEPESPQLAERLERLAEPWPIGYTSELCLAADAWLAGVSACLRSGVVLLLDYGFPRHEFYHPERQAGTLMCHYRHRAHDDPFVYPGLQDITAHVDFTAIAEAAVASAMDVLGYNTQGFFLLANGLTDLAAEARDEREQWLLAQQIRSLTMPTEMGELFKVMALGRNYDMPLQGFSLQDLRNRL